MDDFNALASSLAAGLRDVRGCLILSRDGLVLGSSPAEAQASVTPAWVRFAALGDTERGFAQFGGETWCYVRRGPYGAFAIAGPGARPGLVLDQMDQALLAAEEARTRHDLGGPRTGEISLPTSRPRTLLHPEPDHGQEPVVIDVPRNQAALADPPKDVPPEPEDDLGFAPFPATFRTQPQPPAAPDIPTVADTPIVTHTPSVPDSPAELVPSAESDPDDPPRGPGHEHVGEPVPPADPPEPDRAGRDTAAHEASERDAPAWDDGDEPREPSPDEHDVDRFSLAQEFGQLLQRGEDPADG